MAKRKPEFTRADFDALKRAQRILHDLAPTIDKAESCGVECEGYRAIAREIGDRLMMIETHFLSTPPER